MGIVSLERSIFGMFQSLGGLDYGWDARATFGGETVDEFQSLGGLNYG